ncbi:hypothetical protein J6590_014559 [Homalodisca vitripennis]|nr:hypothetical protein J6590_014559 [Homalodisca vitripennis]
MRSQRRSNKSACEGAQRWVWCHTNSRLSTPRSSTSQISSEARPSSTAITFNVRRFPLRRFGYAPISNEIVLNVFLNCLNNMVNGFAHKKW